MSELKSADRKIVHAELEGQGRRIVQHQTDAHATVHRQGDGRRDGGGQHEQPELAQVVEGRLHIPAPEQQQRDAHDQHLQPAHAGGREQLGVPTVVLNTVLLKKTAGQYLAP